MFTLVLLDLIIHIQKLWGAYTTEAPPYLDFTWLILYSNYTNLSLLIGIKKKFNPQLFTISFLHFFFFTSLSRLMVNCIVQQQAQSFQLPSALGPHVSIVEILIESQTLGPILSKTYLKSPFVLLGKIFNMHENRFQLYPSQSAINNRLIGKQFQK